MSELKFTREDNEKYKTISISIENAIIEIKKDDYYNMKTEKTKFGYKKSTIQIYNKDLIEKLKSWEEEINEYLESEVGTEPITILYGNRIYPKDSTMIGQKKKDTILL